MGTNLSMLGKLFQNVIDFFTGIFAFIPQVIYFLYTCFMSLLDLLQFIARKLVGLDVYYVNGKSVSGDIVSDFISGVLGINGNEARYSSLSTVFWSLVVFGCIQLHFRRQNCRLNFPIFHPVSNRVLQCFLFR